MATNMVGASSVLQDKEISQFTVYAPGGMGYAFWIRVEFRDAPKGVDIGGTWYRSDRGKKVTVWKTGSMNLCDIVGIEAGMEVRLDIEVQSGTENVRAGQSFIYNPNANLSAYYEAKGTCRDAAVNFIKYRDPE